MPSTPISASVNITGTTPVTIYTVPAGRTAIVKSVLTTSSVSSSSYPNVTLNKVSGGITYPLIYDKPSGYNDAIGTYYAERGKGTLNLLEGPITLGSGDSISISSSSTPYYKFEAAITTTTNPNQRITNIYYINNTYIAIGQDVTNGYGLVLTSSDALTWTKQTFNFVGTLLSIAYDGTTNYVAVGTGTGNKVFYSTNLTSWTSVSYTGSSTLNCVTYGNSRWVAGGTSGGFIYATTPTSWTSATAYTSGGNQTTLSDINDVAAIGTNWVFGADLLSYTSNSSFTASSWNSPHHAGQSSSYNSFAIDSAGKLYHVSNVSGSNNNTLLQTSTNNGKTWTGVNLGSVTPLLTTNTANVISLSNGTRLIIESTRNYGDSTFHYLYSTDGNTWVASTNTGGGTLLRENGFRYITPLAPSVINDSTLIDWMPNRNNGTFAKYSISGDTVGWQGFFEPYNQISGSPGAYLQPNPYGFLSTYDGVGSTWVIIGVLDGSTDLAWYYSMDNSSRVNSGMAASSSGYPTCAIGIPNSNSILLGTTTGKFYKITSVYISSVPFLAQPAGNNMIAALAVAGTSTTAKILAVYNNGAVVMSTDGGVNWIIGDTIPTNSGFNNTYSSNNSCLRYNNGVFVAKDTKGIYYTSSDGFNWQMPPQSVQSIYNLNSNNIFLGYSGRISYTTGTVVDTFTHINYTGLASYPSTRRMIYVGGTYLASQGNNIHSSSDLVKWTSVGTTNVTINNIVYPSYTPGGSHIGLTYSGTGSNFVVSSVNRTPSSDNVSISKPSNLTVALGLAAATAGILEVY